MSPSPEELVVLVDASDRQIGVAAKSEVHRTGDLHRAFSVFVFNARGETLLQRRAPGKYHSGGLWTNACCGHPRPDEPVADAAARRLREELGFSCPLSKALEFTYRADVGGGLIEHEYDHVFFGAYDGEVNADPAEAAEVRWMGVEDVEADIARAPAAYTPWFKPLLPKVAPAWRPGRSPAT